MYILIAESSEKFISLWKKCLLPYNSSPEFTLTDGCVYTWLITGQTRSGWIKQPCQDERKRESEKREGGRGSELVRPLIG